MTEYYVWTSPNNVDHLCDPETLRCITCGQWHWNTAEPLLDSERDASPDEEGYSHADR